MDDYSKIDEALSAAGLSMTAVFVPQSHSRHAISADKRSGGYNGKGEPCINWKCTVFLNDRELWTGDYTQGIGHVSRPAAAWIRKEYGRDTCIGGHAAYMELCEAGRILRPGFPGNAITAPSLRDVFHSLLMDGEAYVMSFEEWADNYGFSSDSRKAEATYIECAAIGRALSAGLSSEALDGLRDLFQDY
jgi:hypothetical protein